MTTIEISAQAPASPMIRLEGTRVCAVVIAYSPCPTVWRLSNQRPGLDQVAAVLGSRERPRPGRSQGAFALVRPVGQTGSQAVVHGRATEPVVPRMWRGPAGFLHFSVTNRDKAENTVDIHSPIFSLRGSMQRTPNAAKSAIFAFVARISMR
jgi:hypothetical protein